MLTLHGQEHALKGRAEVERKGQSFTASIAFPLKISEYGISIPNYAGITIEDEVQVKIQLKGNP